MNRCCLCGKSFKGFGNNAMPIKEGVCCDKCNAEKVVTERIKRIKEQEAEMVKQMNSDSELNERRCSENGRI